MAAEHVTEITEQNFEDEVVKSEQPVMVDFWAPWCGPCRMVSPIIDELGTDFAGKAKIGKINVDDQEALAERFNVMTIPTVCVFVKGEMVNKLIGARPKADFAKMLEKALS